MATDSAAGWSPPHDQRAACAMENHDWRRDPFVVLPSNPPQYRVVCASCGLISARPISEVEYDRIDVRTWPRA